MIKSNEVISRRLTDYASENSIWEKPIFRKIITLLKRYPRPFVFIVETFYKVGEKYELELFKRIVKRNMIIFDIGANIGIYTLRAAKLIGDRGNVYAFEPEIYNYTLLKKRVKKEGIKNVLVEKLALSDKKGKTRLFIDGFNPGNHSFSSNNLYCSGGSQLVKTTTIDKYISANKIKKVDLIVMDVQGAESNILRGAINLLKKGNTRIMMEYWPQGIQNLGKDPFELIKRLVSYGYKIDVIDKQKKRLVRTKPNVLCKEAATWLNSPKYTNLILTK